MAQTVSGSAIHEGIVYADTDLAMIPVAKAAADPAGHYARPHVTRLLFSNRSSGSIDIQVPTGRKWRRVCV
jgi:hypothetical protein